MTVVWDPALTYRAYYDLVEQYLDLVTDNIVDDAYGRVFPTGMALVVDPNHRFCDLEVLPFAEWQLAPVELPERYETTTQALATHLTVVPARVNADPNLGRALVRFSEEPGDWVRLASHALWLLLSEDRLLALLLGDLIDDPDGKKQSAWLDSLGLPD